MGLRQNGFLNILAICGLCFIGSNSSAQTQNLSKTSVLHQSPHIFELPAVSAQLKSVVAALSKKNYSGAESGLKQIITAFPWNTDSLYLLASLMAIQERKDEALSALEKAIDLGFRNQAALYKDPNFTSIRNDKRFEKLAEKLITILADKKNNPAAAVSAQAINRGTALVSSRNTVWDKKFHILKSYFKFSSRKGAGAKVQRSKSPASKKLNELFQRGLAAGNMGDLYDNRDKQHSRLIAKDFPQLSFTKYSDKAILYGTDYGLNSKIFF